MQNKIVFVFEKYIYWYIFKKNFGETTIPYTNNHFSFESTNTFSNEVEIDLIRRSAAFTFNSSKAAEKFLRIAGCSNANFAYKLNKEKASVLKIMVKSCKIRVSLLCKH